MKNVIKKSLATMTLAFSSGAVVAGTSNASDNSSNGAAVIGFFAILVGALVIPALGHKTHH